MYSTDFDDKCRSLVMAIAGVHPQCPKCGYAFSPKVTSSFMSGQRVKCGRCDFYGNWRYGSILGASRLSNTQFLALFFKYTLPNDAPGIANHLGIDPNTVRDWREKIITLARS